jgi:hypothetical protein
MTEQLADDINASREASKEAARDAVRAAARPDLSGGTLPAGSLIYQPGVHGDRQVLFAALIKAKASFEVAGKTEENPHFRKNYAPLSEVKASTDPHLHAHGLAMVQPVDDSGGSPILYTVVIHESGSYMCATIRLGDVRGVQEFGSKLSYLRRYSRLAMLDVSVDDAEDDDGETATGRGQAPPQQPRPPQSRQQPAPRETKPAPRETKPAQTETKPAPRETKPAQAETVPKTVIDTTATPAPGPANGNAAPASLNEAHLDQPMTAATKGRLQTTYLAWATPRQRVGKVEFAKFSIERTGREPNALTEHEALGLIRDLTSEGVPNREGPLTDAELNAAAETIARAAARAQQQAGAR